MRHTPHIKGIVDGLLQKWETGNVKKGAAVKAAWQTAVAEKDLQQAYPVSLKNGVLTVIVENSTRLYKLTLEKRKIIEKFNKNYTGRKKAKDIRFRVGGPENNDER